MKRDFVAQFGERLKFLSPQPRRRDFLFASTRFWGTSEFLPQPHRAVAPHFRFKKDLILYLNSSRAASSGEFKFNDQALWQEVLVTTSPIHKGP